MLGILGSIFGVLGIFTFGLIFVPLGLLCSLFSFIKKEFLLGLISLAVNLVAIFVSPTVWITLLSLVSINNSTNTTNVPQHKNTHLKQSENWTQNKFSSHSATQDATKKSLPYLFEQLEKTSYKQTFESLFVKETEIEPWLLSYIRDRNGVETPGIQHNIQGSLYESYEVCEPHMCGKNMLYVLFDHNGSRAWAFLVEDDRKSRFFGNPDSAIQTILQSLEK